MPIDLPVVMGIINITPDSFYKGHASLGMDGIVSLAGKMIEEGASMLDIGGQSTRPGSERINAGDETDRVVPVIEAIKSKYPDIIISIDTYYSGVAEAAINAGAGIVNDISGGEMDQQMFATVAGLKVPYICMHMKGTPGTMQKEAVYEDLLKEILDYFIVKVAACKAAGIMDVIVDPGFGFGKTIAHNMQLLKNMDVFKMLEKPLLAGLSRKSTIYKTLGITAEEALNGTTVLNTIALTKGAAILRVHDVKAAKEAIDLYNVYNKS